MYNIYKYICIYTYTNINEAPVFLKVYSQILNQIYLCVIFVLLPTSFGNNHSGVGFQC